MKYGCYKGEFLPGNCNTICVQSIATTHLGFKGSGKIDILGRSDKGTSTRHTNWNVEAPGYSENESYEIIH